MTNVIYIPTDCPMICSSMLIGLKLCVYDKRRFTKLGKVKPLYLELLTAGYSKLCAGVKREIDRTALGSQTFAQSRMYRGPADVQIHIDTVLVMVIKK